MNVLRYSLSEEGYVNRFITTGVFTEPQTLSKSDFKRQGQRVVKERIFHSRKSMPERIY